MHKIKDIIENSICDEGGIEPGDFLVSINGEEVLDLLHYQYLITDEYLEVEFLQSGESLVLEIEKEEDEDIGLIFENDLMDKERACKNNCIFCFITQMPKNMRKSLYFRDDDYRLSFVYGNYLTLTNLSQKELDRIGEYQLKPLYVSIHTMNGLLRARMLNNPKGAMIKKQLLKLLTDGIDIHGQIVLCPGWNDGEELRFTLHELIEIADRYPGKILTTAIVPVGLTKYREGLTKLRNFRKEESQKTIALIEEMNEEAKKRLGQHLFFPADEFYLSGGLPIPPYDFYGDFLQIEDGIGMTAQFVHELKGLERPKKLKKEKKILWITGKLAENFIKEEVKRKQFEKENVKIEICGVENTFFGKNITVAGLLTAQDILNAALPKLKDYDALFLPETVLNREGDRFLDDMLFCDFQEKTAGKTRILNFNGSDLKEAIESIS